MLSADVRAGQGCSSLRQSRPQRCGRARGTSVLERTIGMAKFIYLYRGPATPMSDRILEQGAERQAVFGAWMERVGAALVDVGSPFGTSASVRDDGTEGTAGDLIGYTIVEVDDLAAAKAFIDGFLFLVNGEKK